MNLIFRYNGQNRGVRMEDIPQLFQQFRGHKDVISASHFSPNGKQVVSSSLDHSLMLWNFTSTDSKAYRYTGHTGPVLDVQFSRSGALLASSSRDGSVRLWVPDLKGESQEFKACQAAVRSVQFSPDNLQLVTGSDDKSIKVRRGQFTGPGSSPP
jgi:centriolar protein POC1